MTLDQLALVVDPVAWLLAILGGLGTVGMALGWSIQAARHHNDGVAWTRERRELQRKATAARGDDHRKGYVAGWQDAVWTMSPPAAVADDEEALAAHHTAAANEGLLPPERSNLMADLTPDEADQLYLKLHGAREALCLAQRLVPPHWRSDLDQVVNVIDNVGSSLVPIWSRHNQPEYPEPRA